MGASTVARSGSPKLLPDRRHIVTSVFPGHVTFEVYKYSQAKLLTA